MLRRFPFVLAFTLAILAAFVFLREVRDGPSGDAERLREEVATQASPQLEGRGDAPGSEEGSADTRTLAGRVVDEEGQPAPGVVVVVLPSPRLSTRGSLEGAFGPLRVDAEIARTRSDPQGAFRLEGPQADCLLVARPDLPLLGTSVRVPVDETAEVVLFVVKGVPVTCRVVDAQGDGVRSLVQAFPRGHRRGRGSWGVRVEEKSTDADGRLRFEGLPAGPASFRVRVPERVVRTFAADLPHEGELVFQVFDPEGAIVEGHVRDERGASIAGAEIALELTRENAHHATVATGMAVASEDGIWRMAGLPLLWMKRVHVRAGGHPERAMPLHDRPLRPGATERIDLVLPRAGRLTGVVRSTDGARLEHATVQLLRDARPDASTLSTADGRYALALPAGERLGVYVRLPGWYLPEQVGGVLASDHPGAIELEPCPPAGEIALDLLLARAPRVAGRCVTREGEAASGAIVGATPDLAGHDARLAQQSRGSEIAAAGPDGAWAFPGLAPGIPWRFEVIGGGWQALDGSVVVVVEDGLPDVELIVRRPASIRGRVTPAPARLGEVESVTVRIGDRHRATIGDDGRFEAGPLPPGSYQVSARSTTCLLVGKAVEVKLVEGATVDDIVLMLPEPAVFGGVVVDEDGEPVGTRALQVRSHDDNLSLPRPIYTDANGRFETRLWGEGPFTVLIGSRPVGTYAAGRTDHRVVLTPPEGVSVVLRVVDPEGQPVSSAMATVLPAGTSLPIREGFARVRRGALPVGSVVRITTPRDADHRPLPLLGSIEVPGELGDELVIRLERGEGLAGRVLDEDGNPVAGVAVRGGRVRAASDANGRFVLLGVSPPAVVTTRPPSPWIPSGPIDVDVFGGPFEIRLQRGRAFRLTLRDPAGEPARGLRVSLEGGGVGADWSRHGETDAKGVLAVEGIPPEGVFAIEVRESPGRQLPEQRFAEMRYGSGEVALDLQGGVYVHGVVRTPDGSTPRTVSLRIAPAGTWPGQRVQIRGQTDFALGPVLPGRYVVYAEAPGYAPSRPVEVEAPSEGLVIPLPLPVALEGRVVDAGEGRYLLQWMGDGDGETFELQPDGSFGLSRLRDDLGTLYVARTEAPFGYFLAEGIRPSDGPFEVRLRAGQSIEGRVVGVRVIEDGPLLLLRRASLVLSVYVERDGRFIARNVPPGVYRAEVWLDGRQVASRDGVEAGSRGVEFSAAGD